MEYPTVCLASAVRWHEKVGAVFRMVASTLSLKALALLVYVLGFVATLNRKRQGCEGIDSRLFTSSAKLTWFHVRFRVFVLFCFSFFFFRFRCCHRLSFFSFFSFFFSCAAVPPPPTSTRPQDARVTLPPGAEEANDGCFFYLAGVSDYESSPDYDAALDGRDDGVATVLLAHQPTQVSIVEPFPPLILRIL